MSDAACYSWQRVTPVQMERSPIITLKFHLRAVTLLLLLATLDIFFIRQSWNSLKTRGASVEIVFGLEVSSE